MKRREILKKAGAGVAASVAASGVASARGTLDDSYTEALADPDRVRASLEAHDYLLEGLVDEGVLASADVEGFDLESSSPVREHGEGVDVRVAEREGVETPMLVTSRLVDDGMLTVHVLPEDNQAFAFVRDYDGDIVDAYNATTSLDHDCSYCYNSYCSCEREGCNGCCQYTCYCVCDCDRCDRVCNVCPVA